VGLRVCVGDHADAQRGVAVRAQGGGGFEHAGARL
jgi:hypothetical protein